MPASESLKDTIERVLPYYEAEIVPALRSGKRVLVSAHGNSLRALIKHLSNIGDEEIVGLEIPTGEPIVYELDDDLIRPRPLLSVGASALKSQRRLNAVLAATRPLYACTFPRRRGP